MKNIIYIVLFSLLSFSSIQAQEQVLTKDQLKKLFQKSIEQRLKDREKEVDIIDFDLFGFKLNMPIEEVSNKLNTPTQYLIDRCKVRYGFIGNAGTPQDELNIFNLGLLTGTTHPTGEYQGWEVRTFFSHPMVKFNGKEYEKVGLQPQKNGTYQYHDQPAWNSVKNNSQHLVKITMDKKYQGSEGDAIEKKLLEKYGSPSLKKVINGSTQMIWTNDIHLCKERENEYSCSASYGNRLLVFYKDSNVSIIAVEMTNHVYNPVFAHKKACDRYSMKN